MLIEKIDRWKREIIKKVEQLKQNLKDEISFMEKIIFNYNYSFENYTYFKLFRTIEIYVKNTKNDILEQFYKENNFEKQTDILIQNIFKFLGKKLAKEEYKIIKRTFENKCKINNAILERINGQFFALKSNYNIHLCYYNELEKKMTQCKEKVELGQEIYSISVSTIKNKILICLLNNNNVKIIDYNLKDKKLELNKKDISRISLSKENSHFYKCIQVKEDYFLTSDEKYITIWAENSDNFKEIKNFEINTITYDLLLIDDNYFISSQPGNKTLTLYDIKNLSELKIISDIDCSYSHNIFFILKKKYIIIQCNKGIGLFLIKTKELVQYFEYDNSNDKRISCDNNYNIFILSMKIESKNYKNNFFYNNNYFYNNFNNDYNDYIYKIKTANIIDDEIKFINESKEMKSDEGNLKITYLYKDIILLWGNNLYLSKEEKTSTE